MKAARMLIESMTADFDATTFRDSYRDDLMRFINARARGKELEPIQRERRSANVVDLAEVLRRSLDARHSSTSAQKSRRHGQKRFAVHARLHDHSRRPQSEADGASESRTVPPCRC